MRVEARRALLIDSAIGLALAVASWMASFYVWERSEFSRPEWRHGPPRHMVTSRRSVPVGAARGDPRGTGSRHSANLASCSLRRDSRRGRRLSGGRATFAPIFLGPALAVYSMAGGASIFADKASAGAPRPAMPPLRSWAPLLVLLVPMIMAGYWREPYLGLLDPAFYGGLVSVIAIAVVPAMIALLVRSRRESEREVREQERRRYAYEERLRIARDVHDVVGHSLAVITMQAGVALHLLDKERTAHPRPDQVASSLEAIKKTSREALAELRTTLEVFRADSEEPRSPLPGLARLDDLVDGLRSAGREVTLVREQSDDDLQEAAGGRRPGGVSDHPGVAHQRRPACPGGSRHRARDSPGRDVDRRGERRWTRGERAARRERDPWHA